MKTKKNITFIIFSLDSGGAERVVVTLANHFANIYNVSIITLLNKPSFYPLDERITLLYCVDKISISTHIFGAIKNNVRLFLLIKRHLKVQKAHMAISFMTTSNVLCVLASNTLKIPCIISERSNPYIYTHNTFWNKLIRYSYPKTRHLVVQSNLIKNFYNNFVENDKIKILPNPISKELTRAKQNFDIKENVILNVGRLDQNKAQDLLIKAFANINHENWKLVFVGEGELRWYYEQLVDQLNLKGKVLFRGNSPDVESMYNTASIFAFTSKSEGFPNALIEAMYFELACVSTDCPTGPSEIIIDGKNGFLIEVGNQSQLEDRLEKLITDPNLRNTFGNEAFLTAKSFEVEYVAKQWHELITSVL